MENDIFPSSPQGSNPQQDQCRRLKINSNMPSDNCSLHYDLRTLVILTTIMGVLVARSCRIDERWYRALLPFIAQEHEKIYHHSHTNTKRNKRKRLQSNVRRAAEQAYSATYVIYGIQYIYIYICLWKYGDVLVGCHGVGRKCTESHTSLR